MMMKPKYLTVLSSLLFLTQISSVAEKNKPAKPKKEPPAYDASVPKPTVSDFRYGPHVRQVFDFWKADTKAPAPLVFVIHGGGWVGGAKEAVHSFAEVSALLEAGISVVAINYRYIRQAKAEKIEPPVKLPMHDAARALQVVRSRADEWNIDKQRIAATGGSAGGCTSLWLAFHDDLADPNSENPVARESTRLWCAAVTGAQTTLDPKEMIEWIPNVKYGSEAFGIKEFPEFLAERENLLPWIAEYSPNAWVSAGDPPIYMFYKLPPTVGEKHKTPIHSSNFGAKLQEHCASVGVACELNYEGAPNVKHETATAFLIETLKR